MLSVEEQIKECRKANNVLGTAVVILVIVSLIGLPIVYLSGRDDGVEQERREAARCGFGTYSLNTKTGDVDFDYHPPKEWFFIKKNN